MSRNIKIILTLWTLTAIIVVCSGVLTDYSVRVAQAIGTSLTLSQILFFSLSKSFRSIVMAWSLRNLTLFQSWRILPGALFLYYYYGLGKLSFDFAVIGGYGDMLVGITAIFLCPLANADQKRLLRILLVWQVLALADLLFVIRSGFVASFTDPNVMRPLTEFPLGLLPTLLVPITLFAHFVAIAQLRKRLSS
ncbi:MAG TPA: hypothetical protein VM056_05625 [Terriglobales bacterium]|nr:hypothetical protein [Terriglobales bacterium]